LAREIHDELGAELSLLKIDVTSVQRRTEGNKQVQDKTKSILKQLDDAILTIQQIATDLRPPLLDTFGLGAAIDWYMDTNCERAGFDCEKDIDMELDVDAPRATAIFRVFQEAFTNIIRHARATKIMVQLKQDQATFTLVIKDDGVGIREGQTLTPNGLGFVCMRERLRPFEGTLTLVGRPQQGTTVTVMVPKRVGSQ
jgi:signal transduction histidine kinase